jgi:hypothetical protein
MHIVTLSLSRAAPKATAMAMAIDTDALARKLVAMDDVARVEHARVVATTSRVHIVLFLLAPTYCEAHASALRICRRALESTPLVGWAVEDHAT